MIGSKQIVIDASDFIKGMSSSNDIADGGFSNDTDAVNLTYNPGVLYAPPIPVDSDTDTRLTGNLIASSQDMNTFSPYERLFVSDDGKAYRYNGTKLNAAGVALTAGKTWAKGYTDIITFGGEAYITSKESITRWQNDDTIDGGADYPFSFANSNAPHPAIVFENNAYYGDKNLLKIQSTAGVAPTTILTLSDDQVIVSLGIDAGSGLMLISTCNSLSVQETATTVSKLLWYDGNSTKPVKAVITDATILGFHSVGGTTYVGYGQNLGYINGSGITFLRKLKNVGFDVAQLPYKHNITHINNTLYVLDGLQVLAFGEILPGQKKFYYALKNNTNANKPTVLAEVGSGKLGVGFATTKFYTFNTTSSTTDGYGTTFITNKYEFPRPVFLRSAYVEYADAVTNSDGNRSLYCKTETQGSGFVQLSTLTNSTGASVYFVDKIIGFPQNKVRFAQFRYISANTNFGVRRIIIYYDVAE